MKRDYRKNHIIKICVCAMLVGISVEIGTLCRDFLNLTPTIRITFENLPVILSGILFGPVYGMLCGTCTDVVSSVITGQNINPIITVGALSVGLVSGLVVKLLKKTNISDNVKNTLSCASAHVVGSLFIKTFGLHLYYFSTSSFWYLFGTRFLVYLFICTAECIMISLILKNKYIKGLSSYEL
ncbi:MAG: folate family ECF transporter S component [Clostridia bacterium]|nr:folate family ECF transporter S component [Clostridia bacterium]